MFKLTVYMSGIIYFSLMASVDFYCYYNCNYVLIKFTVWAGSELQRLSMGFTTCGLLMLCAFCSFLYQLSRIDIKCLSFTQNSGGPQETHPLQEFNVVGHPQQF